MSNEEQNKTDLPPVGVFVPDEQGLVSWVPQFDRIRVHSTPWIVDVDLEIAFHGEGSKFVRLSSTAAKHLASVLLAAAAAVDKEAEASA